MRRKILLTAVVAAFSLKADAQITDRRMFDFTVLHTPDYKRALPASHTISPVEISPGIKSLQQMESFPLPVAIDAATQHLPFFCRQELTAEKRFGVPLRLRLGSVQYTDWLEQKPGAVAPH